VAGGLTQTAVYLVEGHPQLAIGQDADVSLSHLGRARLDVVRQLLDSRRHHGGSVQRPLDLDNGAADLDVDPALVSYLRFELYVEVVLG
jgi:hypothetical protein